MSTDTPSPPTDPNRDEIEAYVDEHRDRLERIAASDLPLAEYCQRLLDYVEGGGRDG